MADSRSARDGLLAVACVVMSAFCLFLIQPLMAKRLLPVFGGTAAVWAACLVFYQTMLLAGYLYAYWSASRLSSRMQAIVHMALAAVSLLVLPLASEAPVQPGSSPSFDIARQLIRIIGLPYLLLSATSPVMQHWQAGKASAQRVYRLFAWSNVACIVALLGFPFALERFMPTSAITQLWQAAFAVSALLHAGCAWTRLRQPTAVVPPGEARMRWRPLWFWLPLLGSALLVALTNHLTQIVAPFPLLWVLPLLLYLLTFVAAFAGTFYKSSWGVPLGFAGLLAITAGLVYLPPASMMTAGIALFGLGLFATCLMLHGELAVRKPEPSQLTAFYVAVAAGGAAGSVFIALLAPHVLKYPIETALVSCVTGVTAVLLAPRWRPAFDCAIAAAVIVSTGVLFGWMDYASSTLVSARNFYGTLRVTQRTARPDLPPLRSIVHGAVNHGAQYVEGPMRKVPLMYFHAGTAAGMLLSRESGPRRIGVVGLGAGTLAAYGRDGDLFRFYEINPSVVDLATTQFAYLNDSAARVEVVLGDARVMMERERPQQYDALLIDAFTGDAVPAHLLTREAFSAYLRHLAPQGTLALHVSNRFLELPPVVQQVAWSLGLRAVTISSQSDASTGNPGAVWVLVNRGVQGAPRGAVRPELLWTDDYSSVLPILR